ncbi:DUF4058 family protein [Nostoc sp. FACHB-87]|uniref:DUF4058 family protein n=1 Tax=Nostocaceae TaxID=1162 RepID=UPI001689FABE|nr:MULTISPECIES: DUF4058 family protein [Nostocaceae]MBD2457505.1 DUF4058 family protein [Nostoc sp. FACHB-87]MBD2478501.1 DUF4058 family protein [Anabaena sp. FACHB-83]
MGNPFPGMNPYLEQPELWHQVHNRLIVAIADDLTPQIAPKYRVSIEERVYTSVDDILLVGIADVAFANRNVPDISTTLTAAKLSEPTKVKLPIPEQVTERFLEVRATQNKEVVAVIELLSPKNKISKEGRTAYESKRQKILASATNLVEIDLLKQGEPMPILGVKITDYSILVSRSYNRPDADLYTFDLKTPIPVFPIPLHEGESEPIIDLQRLLNEVYERARFDLAIDYTQPLKVKRLPEEEAWIKDILAKI